jgi:hypothetical protein
VKGAEPEAVAEWRRRGLFETVMARVPAYARGARLRLGVNDVALLVDIADGVEPVWRAYTRTELLCAVIENEQRVTKTISLLAEARPDPSFVPILVIVRPDIFLPAVVDCSGFSTGVLS